MPQHSFLTASRSSRRRIEGHRRVQLPDWELRGHHSIEPSSRLHEKHQPSLMLDWEEVRDIAPIVKRVWSIYEIAPAVAYGIVSFLLLLSAGLSVTRPDSDFGIVLFVGSIGMAMMAMGRVIEVRSRVR
jgi:hypothetical protein